MAKRKNSKRNNVKKQAAEIKELKTEELAEAKGLEEPAAVMEAVASEAAEPVVEDAAEAAAPAPETAAVETAEPVAEAEPVVEAVMPFAEASVNGAVTPVVEFVAAEAAETAPETAAVDTAEPVAEAEPVIEAVVTEEAAPEPVAEEIPVVLAEADPVTDDAGTEKKKFSAVKKALSSIDLGSVFGDKPVTRKVLAIAVASAVFLNAALTAGLMAVFSNSIRKSMPDNLNNANPYSEQFYDNSQPDYGTDQLSPDNNYDRSTLPDSGWDYDRNYGREYDSDNDGYYYWDFDRDYGWENDWGYDQDYDRGYDRDHGSDYDWGYNGDGGSSAYPWNDGIQDSQGLQDQGDLQDQIGQLG